MRLGDCLTPNGLLDWRQWHTEAQALDGAFSEAIAGRLACLERFRLDEREVSGGRHGAASFFMYTPTKAHLLARLSPCNDGGVFLEVTSDVWHLPHHLLDCIQEELCCEA